MASHSFSREKIREHQ